jgi:Zn-dependent peptidase ImmA (M78 family)
MSHHLLEQEFDNVLLTDDGCQKINSRNENEANFLAGELLIRYQAALMAAFAGRPTKDVAAVYGISAQLAQMRMKGARIHARRALAKQTGDNRRR